MFRISRVGIQGKPGDVIGILTDTVKATGRLTISGHEKHVSNIAEFDAGI